jgi:signal peptidase II
MTLFIITAAVCALAGLDQWIKLWAIDNLRDQPARPFLQLGSLDWMHLRYLENRGAAFSMLSGSRGFLIVFPAVVILLCFYLMHRQGKRHRWVYPALTLIAGGGLGNLIDRVFRGGAVVDYFDFQLMRFAVFNFADVCVTVGVILVCIGIIFFEKELPEAKKLKDAPRLPYARHAAPLEEAETLPLAETLPEAGTLPDAEALPLAETRSEAEPLTAGLPLAEVPGHAADC